MKYFSVLVKTVCYNLLAVIAITTLISTLAFAEFSEDTNPIHGRSFQKELLESGQYMNQVDARDDLLTAAKYYEGKTVPINLPEAYRLFKKSAELGSVPAMYIVGYMSKKGDGVNKSSAEAVLWFKKAAESGHLNAMYDLGYMYDKDPEIVVNRVEAIRWYTMAAERGHIFAQVNLSLMYLNRNNVGDFSEAFRWTREAARNGNATAQLNLGIMYLRGQGVIANPVLAERWLRKSAEQGEISAQYTLGVFYETGTGVKRNMDEAYMWYRKAAEKGDRLSKDKIQQEKHQ